MTRVALCSLTSNMSLLAPVLKAAAPELDVVIWPDPAFREAEVAVCWNTPPGLYREMPHLKLVHSTAAGIDNIVAGQGLRNVPVCRVVDPNLTDGMVQYVLWCVLHYHRSFDKAQANQRHALWQRPAMRPAADCRVGLMGLGQLGGAIARQLLALGYTVSGWSRSAHPIDGMATFAGPNAFEGFLRQVEVLVCVLPLTSTTRGILDRRAFDALPDGAVVVNCGRGEHLITSDLVAALNDGKLRGAVLDVFEREPLPADDALWQTPGLIITPHMATRASPEEVARQVAHNVRQLGAGLPLANVADLSRGY